MSVTGRGNRIPDYQREMKEMRADIRRLELALRNGPTTPPVQKHMPFSWSGTVSGVRTSGPWFTESNGTITGCRLGFEGSGSATVELLIDGVSRKTFVINGTRGGTMARTEYVTGAKVQLRVTGSGGTNLTAVLQYVTNDGW